MRSYFYILLLVIRNIYGNTLIELHRYAIPSYFIIKVREILKTNGNDSVCAKQFLEYAESLQISESWALQMFDASGKPPSGIFEGNSDFGSFDRCLQVTGPQITGIYGQYCIGEISFEEKATKKSVIINSNYASSIHQGFCIPSGCSAESISSIWKQFGFAVKIVEDNCQLGPKIYEFDSSAVAALWFFFILLLVLLVSTAYDCYFYYTGKKVPHPLLTTFSILSNGKQLLTNNKNMDIIQCIHGMRVLSIMWIVLYHIYFIQLMYPLKNENYFKTEWKRDVGNMFIICAPFAVDTFFLIGGLTLTYSFLLYGHKRKFNLFLFYLHRYLRLTPVLAVLVLFHGTLFKYMGSGPFWPTTTSDVVDPCKTDWWQTLLYIQNYFPIKQCLEHAWYLSADVQLYLFSPIILLPLTRWPKTTLAFTVLLGLCSIITSFVVGWTKELAIGGLPINPDSRSVINYYDLYYLPTHTRASVWLIGVVYGYISFKLTMKDVHVLSYKVVNLTLWIVSLTTLIICVFAGYDVIIKPETVTKVESSLYLALVRPAWALSIGWIIFACFKGFGGPVNWFLSLPMFEILGKLSYAIYLVHVAVISIHSGQLRNTEFLSHFNKLFLFWGVFSFSVFFSCILYLAIEYPIVVIERRLLKKWSG